jgi:hypothetical protein
MEKVRHLILSVVHHRQNSLDSTRWTQFKSPNEMSVILSHMHRTSKSCLRLDIYIRILHEFLISMFVVALIMNLMK